MLLKTFKNTLIHLHWYNVKEYKQYFHMNYPLLLNIELVFTLLFNLNDVYCMLGDEYEIKLKIWDMCLFRDHPEKQAKIVFLWTLIRSCI
jgi:hypothetical protein